MNQGQGNPAAFLPTERSPQQNWCTCNSSNISDINQRLAQLELNIKLLQLEAAQKELSRQHSSNHCSPPNPCSCNHHMYHNHADLHHRPPVPPPSYHHLASSQEQSTTNRGEYGQRWIHPTQTPHTQMYTPTQGDIHWQHNHSGNQVFHTSGGPTTRTQQSTDVHPSYQLGPNILPQKNEHRTPHASNPEIKRWHYDHNPAHAGTNSSSHNMRTHQENSDLPSQLSFTPIPMQNQGRPPSLLQLATGPPLQRTPIQAQRVQDAHPGNGHTTNHSQQQHFLYQGRATTSSHLRIPCYQPGRESILHH